MIIVVVIIDSLKCQLVVKPEKEGRVKEMFAVTGINITEGCKPLGTALGSRCYFEQYVGNKVEDWVGEVTRLAEFARCQLVMQHSHLGLDIGGHIL